MTVLDRATKFLIEADFFQMNDTYFVNHIAVEEEGPAGFGCFALETPSEFSLYPLDDPVCSSTTSVVCGMPSMVSAIDGQKIANAIHTLEPPTDTNNTSDTVNPDDGNGNHTVTTLPSGINLAEVITKSTSSKSNGNTNTANHIKGENEISFFSENKQHEEIISIGDLHYSVIRLHQVSPSPASILCDHHYEKIGSLYSSSIPQFSTWFQSAHPSEKIVIESWNGDNYGAKDDQCLTFSVSHGVHLSECSEASTVLCEKMFAQDDYLQ
ncbi:unnamed protein product [Absidia cylindrospora]